MEDFYNDHSQKKQIRFEIMDKCIELEGTDNDHHSQRYELEILLARYVIDTLRVMSEC